MAADSLVFGIKIILIDHSLPITQDTTVGLYNFNSSMAANANSGQKNVTVDDGTKFVEKEVVTIKDDVTSESNTIDSIAGDVLTMFENLTNSYTTGDNGIVHANSKFQWIQNDIDGLSGWCSTMLAVKGIGKWTNLINLQIGGNIAQSGAGNIGVKNTSKFWSYLETNEIFLSGLKAEIYEIVDTTPSKKWSGVCKQPKWDVRKYSIPLKGFLEKRDVSVGTFVNATDFPDASGDILENDVPITIGELLPIKDIDGNIIYSGYAKTVRVGDKQEDFVIYNSYQVVNTDTDLKVKLIDPVDTLSAFPVLNDSYYEPQIKLGLDVEWKQGYTVLSAGTYSLNDWIDDVVEISGGNGEGQFRKIESAVVDLDSDETVIDIILKNSLGVITAGNATATSEDNSWTKIKDVSYGYQIDTWPLNNFMSADGEVLPDKPELYDYSDDPSVKLELTGGAETIQKKVKTKIKKFCLISDYSFDVENAENKSFNLDLQHVVDDIETLDSIFIKTPTSESHFPNYTVDDIINIWGYSGISRKLLSNGLYYYIGYVPGWEISPEITFGSGTMPDTIRDRDYDSYLSISINLTSGVSDRRALIPVLLKSPEVDFDFDAVYLGIDSRVVINTPGRFTYYDLDFAVKYRRFFGSAPVLIDQKITTDQDDASYIKDMPDFYYTSNVPDTKSQSYHVAVNNDGNLTGYKNFELTGITNANKFNSIKELVVFFDFTNLNTVDENYINLHLREFSFIFKRSSNLQNEIFTPIRGRIFNDTWDSRKTSANMIDNPIDAIEHFSRLQNFSDSSIPPASGWGKAYAPGALIQTTGEGSFDDVTDSNFTAIKNYDIAFQLMDYDSKTTNKIIQTLCKNYMLAKWTNSSGHECVKSIRHEETSPADTITLADIVNRKKIKIIEPKPNRTYPEPLVKYRYNYATEQYESILQVTNADAEVFNASYVKGLSGGEAEEIWNRCNTLWKRCNQLKIPPKSYTNLIGCNGADADTVAKEYLLNWINWMFNPIIRLNVHYNKAGSWEEAHKFNIQLPHQTSDAPIECILTKITKDPNPPYVINIEAIMIKESIADYFIKDTWVNFGDDNDWVDNQVVQGGDDDIIDNM